MNAYMGADVRELHFECWALRQTKKDLCPLPDGWNQRSVPCVVLPLLPTLFTHVNNPRVLKMSKR
jgi:hypothetical protein